MSDQVYFEDVKEGQEIPPLSEKCTSQRLVMWAAGSGDFYQIHYDKDFALSRGLSGVIVQGQLVGAFLGQLLTDWLGEKGELKRLNCSYKGMNYPGEKVTIRGKVTGKYIKEGEHFVECSVWAENPKEEKTASGMAVVVLPSRIDKKRKGRMRRWARD